MYYTAPIILPNEISTWTMCPFQQLLHWKAAATEQTMTGSHIDRYHQVAVFVELGRKEGEPASLESSTVYTVQVHQITATENDSAPL